ncbi:TPA: CPBP family intramembrane metalloprotease, partial [Streptococcus agalactiae]|nr:CPBP family intramembrane metalloprotease [Streptococcus agalactiae]
HYQTPFTSILLIGLELLIIALFLYYAKVKQIIRWKALLTRKALVTIFLGWLSLRVPQIIGYLIMTMQGVKDTANQTVIMELTKQLPLALMLIFTIIGAPIMEEIIFRYIIPKELFAKHQKWGFVIGTLAFALIHSPSDIGSFIIYAGMGAILSFVYYKTEHLEYSIMVHFINNALAYSVLISTMMNN